MPLLSPGRTRAEALDLIDLPALLTEARGKPGWDVPFETADDLRGALIAGSVDDILAELEAFRSRGIDEVVLDLRLRMDAFEATLSLLSRDVLPVFAGA